LETLKNATRGDEIIEFLDTDGNPVHANLAGMKASEIGKRFCVETTKGRKKVLMFGVKIKATIPFSVIKDRTIGTLTGNKTYVRVHHGGFNHGVHWINLGFLLGQHPATSNKETILKDIRDKLYKAWHQHDENYWNKTKKHEIKTLVEQNSPNKIFRPYQIPMVVASTGMASKDGEETIKTSVTMISTPYKFATAATQLMDYLLIHANNLQGYIPLGFKQENTSAFHKIIVQHNEWMDNHRNIQIRFNDAYKAMASPGKDGRTLHQYLTAHPDILAVHTDNENRFNISVDHLVYRDALHSIQEDINKQEYDFEVTVRQPVGNKPNSSGTVSTTTTTTKYHIALSNIVSKASASQTNPNKHPTGNSTNARPNAWNRRTANIPITIDFTTDSDSEFPPLQTANPTRHSTTTRPASTTPSHTSDPSYTTITMTTIQGAVTEAITKVQEEHKLEMASLRAELKLLNETLSTMMKTIAAQSETISEHLVNTNHPKVRSSPPRKRRSQHATTPIKSNRKSDSTTRMSIDDGTQYLSALADDELVPWDDRRRIIQHPYRR
jgi:hypothetical protein